jgi:hypothetical protein
MVYLSLLCILKDEEMNMNIWLEHYRQQGVEVFHMIDNGSTDRSIKIMKQYGQDHQDVKIHIYSLPEKHAQVKHYKKVFQDAKLKQSTKWLIVCDMDEFFYSTKSTLAQDLQNYEDYYVIYSHWLMFGSSGHVKHPEDIRLAMTKRKHMPAFETKYIVQTKYITDPNMIDIHRVLLSGPAFIADDIFPLNHYAIQSEEYFRKVKMTRGDVNTTTSENIRDMNYFRTYNKNMDFTDERLKKWVESMQNRDPETFVNQSFSPPSSLPLCILAVALLFILCILYFPRKKIFKRLRSWVR